MSRKFGNIIATMENLEQEALLDGAEEGVVAEETATEVADVGGEVAVDETKIEEEDGILEQAENAADGVDELTTVAEDSLAGDDETVAEGEVGTEGEGLEQGEATMIEITHETIMSNLGMTLAQRPVFTAESFKDKSARRQATLEALDSLKASAKNIGQGIVAALKSALNTVVNFLVGMLKNRALMEKHLVNLMAKVKTVAGKQKKKETLTAGAAALSIGGQASPETAEKLLQTAMTLVKVSDSVAAAMNSNIEGVTAAAQSGGQDSYPLSGGRTMTISADNDGLKFDIKAGETAKEIAAPDMNQMNKLVQMALNAVKALRAFEGTQSKLKSAVNAIISKLSSAASSVKSRFGSSDKKPEEGGAVQGGAAAAPAAGEQEKKNARMARTVMSKVGGTFPAAAFNAIKATADYVTAGINNYGAGGAEDGGAGAPAAAGGNTPLLTQ